MDFEAFRPELNAALSYTDRTEGGRPPVCSSVIRALLELRALRRVQRPRRFHNAIKLAIAEVLHTVADEGLILFDQPRLRERIVGVIIVNIAGPPLLHSEQPPTMPLPEQRREKVNDRSVSHRARTV